MAPDFSSLPRYDVDPEPGPEADWPDRLRLKERKARNLLQLRVQVGMALGVLGFWMVSVTFPPSNGLGAIYPFHAFPLVVCANLFFLPGCLCLALGRETEAVFLGVLAVAPVLAFLLLEYVELVSFNPLSMHYWLWLGRVGLLIPAAVMVKHLRQSAKVSP